jgi:hypothetical protein
VNAVTYLERCAEIDRAIQAIDRKVVRLEAQRQKLLVRWNAAWDTRGVSARHVVRSGAAGVTTKSERTP